MVGILHLREKHSAKVAKAPSPTIMSNDETAELSIVVRTCFWNSTDTSIKTCRLLFAVFLSLVSCSRFVNSQALTVSSPILHRLNLDFSTPIRIRSEGPVTNVTLCPLPTSSSPRSRNGVT